MAGLNPDRSDLPAARRGFGRSRHSRLDRGILASAAAIERVKERSAASRTNSLSSSTGRWTAPVRIVLDTNILVSALITKATPADQIY